MRTGRYIFIIFFQLGWLLVFAQKEPLRFEHLNTDAGLSNNHVNFIFKDQKGFMWFGTESGLNRYDGSGFRIFEKNEKDSTSLTDNHITRIFNFPEAKIGVKTVNGDLHIYDPITEKFDRHSQDYLLGRNLPNGEISDVRKDSQGNYWFLYEGLGLYKYISKDHRAVRVQLSNDSMASQIVTFSLDSKGNIWLVYRTGYLEKLDNESHTVFHTTFLQIENKNKIDRFSLYIDDQDELWISVYDFGVYYYKPGTGSFVRFHEESSAYRLNSNSISMFSQAIVQDNEGRIWIATDQGGINIVHKKDLSVQYVVHDPQNNTSISQNANLCVYKDNAGIIWTGTFKQGVNSYDKNRSKFSLIKNYSNDPNSLPYEDVNRFAEDAKGNLWIGTNGGGLIYFDRLQNKFTQFLHNPADPNSLCGNTIVSLCMDAKQNLWIGTYTKGMDCYDGKKFIHYQHNKAIPQSVAENNIWEIFQDSREVFWVGTISSGVERFDPGKKTFYHYRNGLPKDSSGFYTYITAIAEDNSGNIMIGTGTGLEIIDKQSGRFDRFTLPFGQINNHILDIKVDSRGLIWIATHYGINLFDPVKKTFRLFRKQDGLPDDIVLTILEDKNQSLWMSTPKGLCNMTIKQYSKDSISIFFKNYTVTEGLQGKAFNENAAFKTKAGELVFGGPFGINIFKPERIILDQAPPGIVFTDFQISNKSIKAGEIVNGRVLLSRAIPETKTITLKYNENLFSIQFASLDFSHTKTQRFEYTLEGFNSGWIISNGTLDNRATYTNLDPGVYVFKIKTVDSDGISSKVISLQITIIPPFWMTWWFRLLIGIAIVGAAVLFYKIRMDIVKRQKENLEINVQERTISLAQAKEKAEQMNSELGRKNKELEQFAYVASHDLQEPLRTSASYVELLQRQYKDQLDARANIYLTHIAQASGRMRVLITDLLDYSRIGNKLELEQIDCGLLFRQILEDLAIVIGETHAEIVADRLPVVNGYYTELKLLFQNLIINAIKFRKKDVTPHIHISVIEKVDCWHFSFRDNGIGIEEKQSEKIFMMFQRLHTRSQYEGSGIGLSHCKKITELHNGKIWVESELNVGSTFHFTISRYIKQGA